MHWNLYSFLKSAQMALAAMVLSATTAVAGPIFSDIVVFGDSLSDTGNTRANVPLGSLETVATLAGYGPNGRFSNGNVWHEYLADGLGISAASRSSAGGNNYAYGGARVDNATGFSAGVLTQEVEYNAALGGATPDADALYIAWAGGNDMRDLVGNADPLAAINQSLDTLEAFLGRLIDSGVSTLLVPNLPDLGSIPEFRTTADAASANFVSSMWNTGLEQRLGGLAATSSASIFYLDVFSVFSDILADPASQGFTNTTDQCRSTESLLFGAIQREVECAGANGFVFWDEIHPTTAAHAALGQSALALLSDGSPLGEVPAPLTLWLLLIGLACLAYTGKGRRSVGIVVD